MECPVPVGTRQGRALASGVEPAASSAPGQRPGPAPPAGPDRTPPSALPSTAGEAAACGLGRRGGATARSRVPLPLVQEHDQPLLVLAPGQRVEHRLRLLRCQVLGAGQGVEPGDLRGVAEADTAVLDAHALEVPDDEAHPAGLSAVPGGLAGLPAIPGGRSRGIPAATRRDLALILTWQRRPIGFLRLAR